MDAVAGDCTLEAVGSIPYQGEPRRFRGALAFGSNGSGLDKINFMPDGSPLKTMV